MCYKAIMCMYISYYCLLLKGEDTGVLVHIWSQPQSRWQPQTLKNTKMDLS